MRRFKYGSVSMDGIRAHTPPYSLDSIDALPLISLSRHVAGDATEGTRREWLATTGSGDYALGTTSLIATRRYHGLLIGAMRAPIGRRMLVPFVDEDVSIGTHRVTLGARRWSDGSLDPDGHRAITGFVLEGSTPTWTYEIGPARLEKRLVMLRDHRAMALVWTLVDAPEPISIDARIFVEHRGQHQLDPDASWLPETTPVDGGTRILLPQNGFAATPTELFVAGMGAAYTPASNWWRRHLLAEERARGYDALGSACHALTASLTLTPRASAALWLANGPEAPLYRVGPMAWYPEANPRGGLDTADAIDASGALGANVSTTKAVTTCGAKSRKPMATATATAGCLSGPNQ